MGAGEDVAVFTDDDAAARAGGDIVAEPVVAGGHLLGGDGHHGGLHLGGHLGGGEHAVRRSGKLPIRAAAAAGARGHLLDDHGVLLVGHQHACVTGGEAESGGHRHSYHGQYDPAPAGTLFGFGLRLGGLPLPVSAAEAGLGLLGMVVQIIGPAGGLGLLGPVIVQIVVVMIEVTHDDRPFLFF